MAKSGKLKRSKFSKAFGKVMSVILCAALLVTTYTGFFKGFGAAAGAIEELEPGEVGLRKTVEQQGDTALVTVETAAIQFEEDVIQTSVIKQELDVIIIIDTSGSMSSTSEGKTIMNSVKEAAVELAESVYELNPDNRVGLVSFAQNSYAYSPAKSGGTLYTSMTGNTNYWFTSSQLSTLQSRINGLSANGGTNSEGGLLAAEKIIDYSNDGRSKLVVFMTDGLPTGRYKDNGSQKNSIATYDGSGSGIPNYQELSEMLEVAQNIADNEKAQLATVFYSGGLTDSYAKNSGMTSDGYTAYYPGCTKSSCNCHTASGNHGQVAIVAPGTEQSEEQELMSGFYHKFDLGSASYIVNDLLAPDCEGGVYMPSNASEMLQAFQDIITSYTQKNYYAPATGAYYDEVIPDYLEVQEDTIQVSMGKAVVLRDSQVTVNGVTVTRDVIRWTIGSIPEEKQTMTYEVKVSDERSYGIMDVSMQGILTYNEVEGHTKTHSPIIVQIDEMILPPKGEDDYFGVEQEKVLSGNVLTNSKAKNILINTSGNADDASTLVNGYAAGLNGDQSGLILNGMIPVLTEEPRWGTVVLNEDGTFTYVQNSELYSRETSDLENNPKATDAYNAITNGWEDSFKYVITTEGTSTAVKVRSESAVPADAEPEEPEVNKYINDEYWYVSCDLMGDTDVFYENGDTKLGHQKKFCGSEENNVIYLDNGVPYSMLHIKRGSGGADKTCFIFTDDTYTVERDVSTIRPGEYIYWETRTGSTTWHHSGYISRPADAEEEAAAAEAAVTQTVKKSNSTYWNVACDVMGDSKVVYENGDTALGHQKYYCGTEENNVIYLDENGVPYSMLHIKRGSGGADKTCYIFTDDTYTEERDVTTIRPGDYIYWETRTGSTTWHHSGYIVEPDVPEEETADSALRSAETETEISNDLEDYSVMPAGVYNAAEALKSEEVTVYIRIKPDFKNLSATKTSSPEGGTVVKAGDEITYTIDVFNPRPADANGVKIIDTVPAGTTLKDAGEAVESDGKLVWTVDIPARDTRTVSFTVTVNDGITGTNNLANVAYVEFTTPGSEETTTVNTNTVAHAFISAVKSSDIPDEKILDAGDVIGYTITVTNNGSADAEEITVSDKLPEGLTFAEGENVTFDKGTVTAAIDVLPAGEKAEVKFTCTVDEFTSGVVAYQNTAYVNDIATNTIENTAQRGAVTVSYIDKDTGDALAEGTVDYGRTGSEYGPYEPAEITNYRHVSTNGSVTGTFTNGNTEVSFLYERIPGTATVRFVDTEGIQLAAPQTVSGWQGDSVDIYEGKVDKIGNYSYQTTDATGTALTESGIVITHIYKLDVDTTLPTVRKSADPADGSTVPAGGYVTYYIDVTNNKYEAMNNVIVADAVPAGMTLSDAGGATENGNALEWVISTIDPGATARVSFTAQVNADNTGSGLLSNTAHVSYVEREATASTEVDSNTVTLGLLVFEKYTSENTRGFYGVGDAITYFIKVRNIGSATAVAEIRDDIPAGTTLCTGSTSATLSLEPGAEQIVSFTAKINDIESYNAEITNTAYVNGVPTNTTTDTVKKAALTVRYEDEEGNTLSAPATYTGTPGEEHPSAAPVTVEAYTFDHQDGTTDGRFVEDTTLEIVNIYRRTPATATVLYLNKETGTEVASREILNGFVGDQIENQLLKEVDKYLYVETNLDDGTMFREDGVTIIHYYSFIRPDDTLPILDKFSDPADGSYVLPGQTITYTLIFNNTRIDPINNLKLTDVIPAGSELIGASDEAGYDGERIVWSFDSVEPGGSVTVSFTVKAKDVLTGSNNLSNVARAAYSNRDFEPEDGVVSNKVSFPVVLAELGHYNDQPDAVLTHGDKITYVVTVSNVGSADAANIPVISFVPDGTTFAGSDDFFLDEDGTVSAEIKKLEPGATAELAFSVTVDRFDAKTYSREINNIAYVNGAGTNKVLDVPKAGNVIVNHVDYNGKTIDTESMIGARINTPYGGYSDLVTQGKLSDRTFAGADKPTSGKVIEDTVVITLRYERIPAALTVRYLETGTGKEVRNPDLYTGFYQGEEIPASYAEGVDIDGYIYDDTAAPDVLKFASSGAEIIHHYTRILDTDVPTVEKTSVPTSGTLVKTGNEIQYKIKVTNERFTDDLAETVVTDTVPQGAAYIEGTASDGGEYDSETKTITWNLGNIPAGESREVTFGVKVMPHPTALGLLGNTAYCGYRDVQKDENHTVASNATTHALIISDKKSSVSNDTVLTEGDKIVYTITATNYGTASAPVSFSDVIPDGLVVDTETLDESISYKDDVLSCSVDSLKPGESASMVFEAIVNMSGKYSINILNTATVNGEDTATTANLAKLGQADVSYVYEAPDGTRTLLEDGEKLSGRVGGKITLSERKTFENLRYAATEANVDDYSEFVEGLIKIVYVYERIPTTATISYIDKDSELPLLENKSIDLYAGDKLPQTYVEAVEYYEYLGCDAPADLTVGENGLTITHTYKEIPDVTELVRVKSSVPAENTAVMAGDTVEYTISVLNPRREEINNVTVVDTVPAGTTLLDGGEAEVNGSTLTWVIDNLQPNESAQFSFTVTVNSEFDDEAANLANRADVIYTNRTEDVETVLHTNTVRHPVLTAVKSADKTDANSMADVTYTITIANHGTVDAENIVITDAVPEGTELLEVPEGALLEDGVLTFAIAKLAAGESKDVSFTVNVGILAEGEYRRVVENTAQVNGHDTNKAETVVRQGDIMISFVDEDREMLRMDERLTGNVGDEITAAPADIEGYELVSTEGNAKTVFTEDVQQVTFVYKRLPSTVKITYVDSLTGIQIFSPTTFVEEEEDEESLEERINTVEAIPGYVYSNTTAGDDEKEDVVHYYEPAEEVYTVIGKVNLARVQTNDVEEDVEEKGIADIAVVLLDKNNVEVNRSVTDKDGGFVFEEVATGNYTAQIEETETYEAIDKSVELAVVEDTTVKMRMKTKVLGAADAMITSGEPAPKVVNHYVNNVETVRVTEPVEVTEVNEADYTKVLGDADTPNTGDNDFATAAALVIAAAALFILVITSKHS